MYEHDQAWLRLFSDETLYSFTGGRGAGDMTSARLRGGDLGSPSTRELRSDKRKTRTATSLDCVLHSSLQVAEVLVKWRQLGYEAATWERLPALQGIDFADEALSRLRSLRPIAAEAEQMRKV